MIKNIRKKVAEWIYPEAVIENESNKYMLGAMCYKAMKERFESGENLLHNYHILPTLSFGVSYGWREVYAKALEFDENSARAIVESYNRRKEKDQ